MIVTESKARQVLKLLGYKNADKYTKKILHENICNLHLNTLEEKRLAVEDGEMKRLIRSIVVAGRIGDHIRIQFPGRVAIENVASLAVEKVEDTKPQPAKKFAKLDRKASTFRSIFEIVSEASKKNPISKEEILPKLILARPRKNLEKLRSAVASFPLWMELYFRVKVVQVGDRYYLKRLR